MRPGRPWVRRSDSPGEDAMPKRIVCVTLVGLFVCWLWGCGTRETEPKKIDRDPFKERNMKAPKP